jgi:small subunit ribosomal protein S9
MDKKTKDGKYIEAVGRRKTSTARVRVTAATKASFVVNGQAANTYFKTNSERNLIQGPLANDAENKWEVEAKVTGGGTHSQAEAVRHGLARALVDNNIEIRGAMKSAGFLKRDARAKERRKFGLKKARKAPQWSKR